MNELLLWIGFIILVFALLIFDLGVFQKKSHIAGMKEAVIMTIFWIVLAMIFNVGIFFWIGKEKSFEFLTGYVVEKSLSVDNLFVFMIIFTYFNVELKYQHKILFWGIVGALITRGIFIFTGITLINIFHYAIYIFGAFLIYTGIKLLGSGDDDKVDPGKNFVLKHLGKYIPVKKDYEGGNFFVKDIIKDNIGRDKVKYFVTPAFIVLLVIETTDVMFAFDSVPAVLSITRDPFIVYTSNIFAILGLRALYFVIARIMPMFYYLNYGLAVVLTFIGVKMVISDFYKIPISISLGIVLGVLLVSIIGSLLFKKRDVEDISKDISKDINKDINKDDNILES